MEELKVSLVQFFGPKTKKKIGQKAKKLDYIKTDEEVVIQITKKELDPNFLVQIALFDIYLAFLNIKLPSVNSLKNA